jgi:hypothetical protein
VGDPELRTTVRSFTTVLLGRGSVQLSSYLDQILASYLGPSVVAALGVGADPVPAADQPVRHGHLGRRAARDGGRDRRQ